MRDIHIINVPVFVDKILPVFRGIIPGKIYKKVHVHSSMEHFHQHVSPDYLPKDYGGHQKCLIELYSNFVLVPTSNNIYLVHFQISGARSCISGNRSSPNICTLSPTRRRGSAGTMSSRFLVPDLKVRLRRLILLCSRFLVQ